MNIKNKASLALLSASLIWGFSFIELEKAFMCGWEPFPLLMCRGIIGGLFVSLFCIKKQWWKDKNKLRLGFISGILFFFGFAFQTYGQKLSSIPNTGFITALYILFTPLISSIFLKKKIHHKIYIACIIALIGTAFLTLDETFTIHLGDLLLLICAVVYAVQIIFNEKCGEANDVLSITSIQLLTMGFCSLLCMPVSGQISLPNEGWFSIIYLAVCSSGIASVLQLFGQSYVEPSRASLLLCLESPIATLLSVLLLGETLTLSIIIGGTCIIGAVLLVELKKTS